MVPTLTPYQEFLVKWNTVHQFFLKNPVEPQDGLITVPDTPGVGMDLDTDRIESEELLQF